MKKKGREERRANLGGGVGETALWWEGGVSDRAGGRGVTYGRHRGDWEGKVGRYNEILEAVGTRCLMGQVLRRYVLWKTEIYQEIRVGQMSAKRGSSLLVPFTKI